MGMEMVAIVLASADVPLAAAAVVARLSGRMLRGLPWGLPQPFPAV